MFQMKPDLLEKEVLPCLTMDEILEPDEDISEWEEELKMFRMRRYEKRVNTLCKIHLHKYLQSHLLSLK